MWGYANRRLNAGDPINQAHPLNRDLLSWWLLTPGAQCGITLFDLQQRRLPLTLTNAPTWSGPLQRPGGWGSLLFGTGSQYAGGNGPNYSPGAWTITAWGYVVGGSGFQGLAGFTNSSGVRYELFIDGSEAPGVTGTSLYQLGATISGGWHWFVGGESAAGVKFLYVDNATQTLGTANAAVAGPNSVTRLGRLAYDATPFTWAGYLDDVRFYSRALPADEGQRLYAQSIAGYPSVLQWLRTAYISIPGVAPSTFQRLVGPPYSLAGRGGLAA